MCRPAEAGRYRRPATDVPLQTFVASAFRRTRSCHEEILLRRDYRRPRARARVGAESPTDAVGRSRSAGQLYEPVRRRDAARAAGAVSGPDARPGAGRGAREAETGSAGAYDQQLRG